MKLNLFIQIIILIISIINIKTDLPVHCLAHQIEGNKNILYNNLIKNS